MPSKVKSPGTGKLVDRQMRNWELARRQRRETARRRQTEVEDFLCISRRVGLEDIGVANRLGERLGWPVFDREILEEMAGDDELRQRIYRFMDERDLSWWEDALRPLLEPEFTRNDYFHQLCRTILSLARQGHGIFVGRGADRILPRSEGFRVRLVAPREMRLEHFAKHQGLDRGAAQREMRRKEQERAEFLRHHFEVEADDPTRADLVLNLERIGVDQAVGMILEARRIWRRA